VHNCPDQARIADYTERKQLRAYVGVAPDPRVDKVVENPQSLRIYLSIKNFGQTSASQVGFWVDYRYDKYPPPGDLPVRPFRRERFVLFPTGESSPTFDIPAPNATQITSIENRDVRLYIFGEIEYLDIFAKKRCTKFRLISGI
jgi:hypothetical protein